VPLTLVVLSARLGAVLPVAALPALRAAEKVLADHTVPDDVAAAAGAERLDEWVAYTPLIDSAAAEVLLTTNPAHPLAASATPGDVEVVATTEPAGSALLDAVAVMDRLRAPGGCPWDAEQTHTSLLQYLVEECYELYQAVEDTDRPALREELGDVLLQVLFHARVAAEGGRAPFPPDGAPFGIDEVAADLVTKLVARHPHVFGDGQIDTGQIDTGQIDTGQIDTAAEQELRWDELKRAEKRRESSTDGVALSQPAAALAAKLVSRARKAGLPAELARTGDELFDLVAAVKVAGGDPEHRLRTAAREFDARVRAAEGAARADGADPHALSAEAWIRYWPSAS